MENSLQSLFEKQRGHQNQVALTGAKIRRNKLKALRFALEHSYRQKLKDALYADFKKPHTETDLTEIYQVISEIKYASKRLGGWMREQEVGTPMALLGSRSWYRYEPKGVCLIISPWNFPVNLTLGPLVSAIAAGNTAILKPSEMTANTSAVMAEMIEELFPEEEIALVQGGKEVAESLLSMPFNHIFFTGSPAVGKIVMKAASEHLSSVTLELGGKSPAIVDVTANLDTAARRIAWGKFLNAGQICVSPDYILVQEKVHGAFIKKLKEQLEGFFSAESAGPASYTHIINQRHYERLQGMLKDAIEKGATQERVGQGNAGERFMAPTLLSGLDKGSKVLEEEIFGPILPIIPYRDEAEALEFIRARPRPLAMYIYSRDKNLTRRLINHTRAGSSCINTNVVQYSNPHLPFGGVNNSGIGKSHGKFGFEAFSNRRAILKQYGWSGLELLYPPYTDFKQRLANWVVKWL